MRILGRGRYVYGTYPQSAGAAGSSSSGNPLSRQRFIDGDTESAGPGAAAAPFATIADFIASRTNDSIADATANYVGWVMPTLAGYVEDVAFPPYVSTELRADSLTLIGGASAAITGNLTWANIAGANAAVSAVVSSHNVSVSGSFTVTDDGGAPSSAVVFSGDELGTSSASLAGGFVSSACTKLAEVLFSNAAVAGINTGTASTSAVVVLHGSALGGDLSAKSLLCTDSIIAADLITLGVSGSATFLKTLFQAGSAPVLTAVGGATFDGTSWESFINAGGTRASGTFALAIGGYSGAPINGADFSAASTNVSLNGTGATAGFTGANSGNHYTTSSATPTTLTLKTGGGELNNDTILITKTNLGANAIAIHNNAGATIATIPANSRGFVLAQFTNAANDWIFVQGGSLAA